MAASLSQGEIDIVGALRAKGVSRSCATMAVIMATREHARPRAELVDIVRQYPGLEDTAEAEAAIAEFMRLGWLIETPLYGKYFIQQARDLRAKIEEESAHPGVAERLLHLRRTLEESVRSLGSMNDSSVYESYIGLLQQAQSEIILPMLATSPKLSSVPVLKERAAKGVRVLVLLSSPRVVARLRGETMAHVAREAISGWKENARGLPNFEVRVSHRIEDSYIASCMLIDARVLRIDVYDPVRQRSLEGFMLEATSSAGQDLNIVRIFSDYFWRAWGRARPVELRGAIWWCIKKSWEWLAFLVFLGLAFALRLTFWSGVFGSAAATLMIMGLGSLSSAVKSLLTYDD
jgi:hypothetical protein